MLINDEFHVILLVLRWSEADAPIDQQRALNGFNSFKDHHLTLKSILKKIELKVMFFNGCRSL